MTRSKILRLTVFDCSFGTGKVTFGHAFCHTRMSARKRARQECRAVIRDLFADLFGGLKEAERRVRVDMPRVVRAPEIGLEEGDLRKLMDGKDVVVFSAWLVDAQDLADLMRDDGQNGLAYVYEK